MQVTRRAHFDNACIKPWRNMVTRGRRWVRLICGSERRPDGRARLKCAVLTDSFQYGNDSDRFGLDPFQIREVQPICFADPKY